MVITVLTIPSKVLSKNQINRKKNVKKKYEPPLTLKMITTNEIRPRFHNEIRPRFHNEIEGVLDFPTDTNIARSILDVVWKDNINNVYHIMRDVSSGIFFTYNTVKKVWTIEPEVYIHRKLWDEYLPHVKNVRDYYERKLAKAKCENNEMDIDNFYKMKIKCERLIDKLSNFPSFNRIKRSLNEEASREVSYKPYHPHLSTNTDFYNGFPGFKAKHVKGADFSANGMHPGLKKLLKHIFIVFANRDKELFKYVLLYLAYPIRYLNRTNVVNVSISKEGTGKSLLYEFLGQFVYGDKLACGVTSFEPLLQQFNGILDGKMLIWIDGISNEPSIKLTKDFNKFESIVTTDILQIKLKYKGIREVLNYTSYAINSNHDIPVKITDKSSSKYFINSVSNELMGNNDYFDDLLDETVGIRNQEVGDLWYTFCLSDDFQRYITNPITGNVPLITLFPKTAARQTIIDTFEANPNCFFKDIFVNGSYNLPAAIFIRHDTHGVIFSRSDLYEVYKVWNKDNGYRLTSTLVKFSKDLNNYDGVIDIGQVRIAGSQPRCCSINNNMLNNIHVYHGMPPNNTIMSLLEYINNCSSH